MSLTQELLRTDISRARLEEIAGKVKELKRRQAKSEQSQRGWYDEHGVRQGGLIAFVRYFWHVLEPETPFVDGWPLWAIAEHLESVTFGEITRLLINVPPGFAKSIMVDVFWPAWEWGPMGKAHYRYVAFSYSSSLTERDNSRFRDLLVSPVYQRLYGPLKTAIEEGESSEPQAGVGLRNKTITKVMNTKTGWKLASSVGGIGTGERGDRVICFPAETRVLTDRGWLEIGGIVSSESAVLVAGFNEKFNTIEWQSIAAFEKNPASNLVEIVHEAGTIRCTPDHPIYVDGRGYVEASRLTPGDPLRLLRKDHPSQAKCSPEKLLEAMPVCGRARDFEEGQQSPLPSASRSSHRLREGKSGPGQSDNALQELPREDARQTIAESRMEISVVRLVRRSGWADRTFNLRVEPHHNYFAGGILVHNCDDLHNVKESESETVRGETVRWFRESVSSRFNNMETGALVVIMQRVHEDDVAGMILEQGFDYCHLMIPWEFEGGRLIAEDGSLIRTSIGWLDPRCDEDDPEANDGELAWPARFSPESMARTKQEVGPYAWHGQFQQSPVARGGGIFQRDWFQLYESKDGKFPVFEYIIGSVDSAFTEKEQNDPSAMTVWGVFLNEEGKRRIMLIDAWRKHLQFSGPKQEDGESDIAYRRRCQDKWGLVEWVAHTCRRFKVDKVLIEAKASGISAGQELQKRHGREGWAIQLCAVKGDKVARALSVQSTFSQMMVYAPARDWASMVIDEAAVFPMGRYDDLTDSLTQAIKHLRDAGLAQSDEEVHHEETERVTHKPKPRPLYPV